MIFLSGFILCHCIIIVDYLLIEIDSLSSFNLYPFPGLHVMNILSNLAGMISTALEVAGDHDVVGAPRDVLWIFHHVGYSFPED